MNALHSTSIRSLPLISKGKVRDVYAVDAERLLLVATAGNVLGSVVNWLLGRGIEHLRDKRWFPFSAAQLDKAQQRYQRYGQWSLLLSWMPVIGDPLTLIAGIMREPFWRFVLLVTLAKAGRYLVLVLLTLGWVHR